MNIYTHKFNIAYMHACCRKADIPRKLNQQTNGHSTKVYTIEIYQLYGKHSHTEHLLQSSSRPTSCPSNTVSSLVKYSVKEENVSRMLTLRTAGRFESGATGLLQLGKPAHTQANEESRRAERSSCLSICVCVCVCV